VCVLIFISQVLQSYCIYVMVILSWLYFHVNPPPPLEAIQSRCAVLRYSKLSDAQILTRLLEVCDQEKVGMSIII